MTSFERRYEEAVRAAVAARDTEPLPRLQASELVALPDPVRGYVLASGAVGRAVPRSLRIAFEARMIRKPGARPMQASAEQVSTFEPLSRSFLMRARMFGLPVRALHLYRGDEATFQVRLASLVDIVDMRGEGISTAETVTVLNDMCVFAPARLADPRLTWTAIDDATASVEFENGRQRVSATLRFQGDDLVDFWSDDRPEAEGGRTVPRRWRTPLRDYRDFGGLRIASHGEAIYERDSGPFTYGEFEVRDISWD